MSKPAVPGYDEISYRRGERRVLIRATSFGFLLFVIVVPCLPNVGPVFRVFQTPSAAMLPTLPVGSYMLVSRPAYGYSRYSFDAFELPISGRWPAQMPRRGDVVVFRLPQNRKIFFVKRVVGLPDDHVQMIRGRLLINGQLVPLEAPLRIRDPSDPFRDKGEREVAIYIERLPDGTTYRIMKYDRDDGPLDNTPEFVVPPGHLFVMGDNRDNSTDSRVGQPRYGVGYVPVELVIGRVIATF